MKLYQIHGFGSVGNNSTAEWLKAIFPKIELVHLTNPVNPAHCLSFAMHQLLGNGFMAEGGCLYGTSLLWRDTGNSSISAGTPAGHCGPVGDRLLICALPGACSVRLCRMCSVF